MTAAAGRDVAADAGTPRGLTSIVLVGALCGLPIALATAALALSRISFGPLALYGNGAWIAPSLGVPLALLLGWTVLVRRGDVDRGHTPRAVAFALGLGLAVGVAGPLETFLAQGRSPSAFGLVTSVLLNGALFVFPTAVVGGVVRGILGARAERVAQATVAIAFAAAALLAPVLPFLAVGIATGAGVTAATRTGRLWVLAASAAAIVVIVLAPLIPIVLR